MEERFGPEYPRGRIAHSVEQQAALDWGPQGFSKEDIAPSLNMRAEDIPETDWHVILEFAVNVGAASIQRTLSRRLRGDLTEEKIQKLREQIKESKKSMHPSHDIFHAAQVYRSSKGKSVTSRFETIGQREQFIDAKTGAEELYPGLFLTLSGFDVPISVALTMPDGRKAISDDLDSYHVTKGQLEKMRALLSQDVPSDPAGRRKEYETLIETILIANAMTDDEEHTPTELNKLRRDFRKILANPPAEYDRFAKQVFAEEWRTNPRLFLDELLSCIRTQPTLKNKK